MEIDCLTYKKKFHSLPEEALFLEQKSEQLKSDRKKLKKKAPFLLPFFGICCPFWSPWPIYLFHLYCSFLCFSIFFCKFSPTETSKTIWPLTPTLPTLFFNLWFLFLILSLSRKCLEFFPEIFRILCEIFVFLKCFSNILRISIIYCLIGAQTAPLISNFRPKFGSTPLNILTLNIEFYLLISSSLPVIGRTLGKNR